MATTTTTANSAASAAPKSRPRWANARSVGALVLLGLVLVAVWAWNRGAEQRAIRNLPAQERRALYARTLDTLRTPCELGTRPPGLESFCRKQAAFALEFPECDDVCATVAKRQLIPRAR
jgi:hypothetical protein